MSFVIATPETVVAAATDLQGIGAALRAANVAAAGPTTALLAAGPMRCRRPLRRCSKGTLGLIRPPVHRRLPFMRGWCRP
ncbi:putative PE-PGRS family protein PE_PGRS24 [Mycobacterium attenuatum]|uniref:Putative PE-PGRS family protein PE_PGRS24 n=1 Tax=Mycobacterium attenuatum TaxID=2341086 RepID=A0A498PZW9_9MYCO|nr:putative PE-PGRS family protein PE_PGRS24 [Mycobacterium attenuatum]